MIMRDRGVTIHVAADVAGKEIALLAASNCFGPGKELRSTAGKSRSGRGCPRRPNGGMGQLCRMDR